ncbi:flagellar hook-associated protein FlgK [Pseudomonas flexibilis]|uniref:Flagellar hook-associated protein 1 n=1 Tax=Pseudomonas flexibilis TaxID=706570 RepID=A0A0B3C1H1_9PSED|nr:flagellar hook-associated protein FlgK [Pseudomonas flexibilis]KHO65412.1 flagellar hook protein FlgK [Pseudomonas flexibilis]SCY59605.1 flagellar hook-associated protein 1 FlgK [Pseudomonas flexibilis]
MAGLLSIGVSGLQASQAQLNTVGHNITNADTAGYSRQQVMQKSAGGQYIGPAGFIGSGTTLQDVRRIYSGFIDTQLQSATSLNGDTKAYLESINQVNSLLADSGTGVNTVLTGFFDALQNVASKPSDEASRKLFLSSAQSLSDRFNSVQTQLKDQSGYLNQQLGTMANKVNDLAKTVAELNLAIRTAGANGGSPNDLLDAREQAVRELNELVGVKTVDQDGQYALFLGNGQPLVIGNTANRLVAEPSQDDPSRTALIFQTPTSRMDVSNVLTGGSIGGLLRYRSEVLDPAMNELGRLSLVVADRVNQQLAQGLDLNGNFGATLFGNINDPALLGQRSIAQAGNTGTGNFEVSISDTSQLTIYDYEVKFETDTSISVRRSDGTVMPGSPFAFDPTVAPKQELTFDGVTVSFSGTAQEGDRFTLIPTRHAAGDIDVALTEHKRLGFAAPLNAVAGGGNYGTGGITQPELTTHLDIYSPDFAAQQIAVKDAMPVKLVFGDVDPATGVQSYKLYDAAGGEIVGAGGNFIPGHSKELSFTLGTAPNTVEFTTTASGSPAKGDSFTIAFNRDGQSDNRNALKLQDLQNAQTVGVTGGKGTSFTTAYGSLVQQVGAKTAQAKADNGATEAILTQASATRESLSGVNLDEEAANLIKFQQYYTASSQIIKAAQETFNTLLSAL